MKFKVLITDYAWPSLDIEQEMLTAGGAELMVAQTGDESELVQRVAEADAIITLWKSVTRRVLDAAEQCLVVSRLGIGVDNIAVDYATQLGILITNVPNYCSDEVSDHAMTLLLACARQITTYARATRDGVWKMDTRKPILGIRGQTLGLIGYGNIARAVIPKALGFGLKIIVYTPRLRNGSLVEFGEDCTMTNNLDTLLSISDYVSVHAPLTAETSGMIASRELRLMKSTAYLINTSRGAIINEAALYQALTEGWIAGAVLDVLVQEPPSPTHPLLSLDNVIVTPHVAYYSESAITYLRQKATEQALLVLHGELPSNVFNRSVLQRHNCRFKI